VIFDSKHNVTEALKNGEMAAVAAKGPRPSSSGSSSDSKRSTPE